MNQKQMANRWLMWLLFSLLPSLSLAQEQAKFFIYGYTQGSYGEKDCNPSVENVLAALQNLDSGKNSSKLFSFDNDKPGIPAVGLTTHAQGVARIPGLENENWLVFTKSGDKPEEAGLIFTCFDKLQSDGHAWAVATHHEPDWDDGQSQLFFCDSSHSQDHPGGVQILGRTLVVGSDGQEGTLVDFYDLTNPYRVQHLNRLLIDGSQGEREIEPGGKGARAHFVSAAKLRDGRYLLFVARHHREILGHPRGKGWFYVSDAKTIGKNTRWKYVSFCSFLPKGNAYQSANLITERPSGNLYLVMMGPEFLQKNVIDLWQLEPHPDPQYPDDTIALRFLESKAVWSRFDGGTFDAGGGIHITPQGEMVIYMIGRWQGIDGNIKVEEYRGKELAVTPMRKCIGSLWR